MAVTESDRRRDVNQTAVAADGSWSGRRVQHGHWVRGSSCRSLLSWLLQLPTDRGARCWDPEAELTRYYGDGSSSIEFEGNKGGRIGMTAGRVTHVQRNAVVSVTPGPGENSQEETSHWRYNSTLDGLERLPEDFPEQRYYLFELMVGRYLHRKAILLVLPHRFLLVYLVAKVAQRLWRWLRLRLANAGLVRVCN